MVRARRTLSATAHSRRGLFVLMSSRARRTAAMIAAAMTTVEAKFGAPATRHPTVGAPPITRWDYAGFSVFFERDRVIHAVVTSG